MNVRATAKPLRRSSIAALDRLAYVPISRLSFNIMLNVLISQRWLFAGVRPAADYVIARTTPVVPGFRAGARRVGVGAGSGRRPWGGLGLARQRLSDLLVAHPSRVRFAPVEIL